MGFQLSSLLFLGIFLSEVFGRRYGPITVEKIRDPATSDYVRRSAKTLNDYLTFQERDQLLEERTLKPIETDIQRETAAYRREEESVTKQICDSGLAVILENMDQNKECATRSELMALEQYRNLKTECSKRDIQAKVLAEQNQESLQLCVEGNDVTRCVQDLVTRAERDEKDHHRESTISLDKALLIVPTYRKELDMCMQQFLSDVKKAKDVCRDQRRRRRRRQLPNVDNSDTNNTDSKTTNESSDSSNISKECDNADNVDKSRDVETFERSEEDKTESSENTPGEVNAE